MSKGSSQQAVPKPPTQPAAPKPQNESYYENGVLRSTRNYRPALKSYVTHTYQTPDEQRIAKESTTYMQDLLGRAKSAVNLSPESIAQYGDAYANPQISALNDSYNKAKGEADMSAAGSGMRNSVGFNHYMVNEVEKNRAQGLADIASNRKMMELDLPNKLLQPYVNEYNLFSGAMQGQQANMMQNLEPAFQGSQAASNAANATFQNQSNALNQNYQNQMNYYNASQPRRGGLFSFFTGGG